MFFAKSAISYCCRRLSRSAEPEPRPMGSSSVLVLLSAAARIITRTSLRTYFAAASPTNPTPVAAKSAASLVSFAAVTDKG